MGVQLHPYRVLLHLLGAAVVAHRQAQVPQHHGAVACTCGWGAGVGVLRGGVQGCSVAE